MSRVHVFLLVLEDRTFKSMGNVSTRGRNFESGHPVLFHGKEAVILGSGATRKEAKANGTSYYNQVCKLFKEEEDNWMFNTQEPEEENGPRSADQDVSHEPPMKKRKL